MDRSRDGPRDDAPPRYTRRSILRGGAASIGAFAAIPGVVTGRQVTQTAVIPSPEPWADDNLAGFMIHVGGSQSPVESNEAECDYENWPPEQPVAYEATIINRKDAETPEQDINLFIAEDVDIPPGALYLINTFERCESGYIGVQIERIGRRDVQLSNASDAPVADVEDDSRPNTQTGPSGAIGPGFGALAAIAAVVGGGLLARLRGE